MKRFFLFLLLTILFFVALLTFFGYKLKNSNTVNAQGVEQASVPTQCIGQALADYMNTVLDGANPQKVKLASTIFNLTNPAEREIFDYMAQYGARFEELDAFAGNTYTLSGVLAYDWYAAQYGWAQAFEANGGHPVIFAEFGDFDQNFPTMRSEFSRSASDGKIIGINFFNAAATGNNAQFSHHIIPAGEFTNIISSNPSKAGINTAANINTSNVNTAFEYSGGQIEWLVEIITGPGDLGGALSSINTAKNLGVQNYVLRLCYATGCGFTNPSSLSTFINDLDGQVPDGINVYIVVGPNEPATERWVAPNCVVEREYTLQEVACRATQDPEFHSLRPYPASPTCNPAPDGVWMCGNDLVVRNTYTLDRRDASSCNDEGDKERCTFDVTGNARAYIDLTDADFPIAGNTERVPNAVSSQNRLPDPVRVNEYVSWYLNGVIHRAEEVPLNIFNPSDIRRIIDFSGPLKKLLPFEIQKTERLEEVAQSRDLGEEGRHNQIIECGGDSPTPCYDTPENPPSRVRLEDHKSDTVFPYTPLSNTEDRTGELEVGTKDRQQERGDGPAGTIRINNIVFNPTTPDPRNELQSNFVIPAEESSKALYFPHIDENGELSELLQFTYLPQGSDGLAGGFSDTDKIVGEHYRPQYCDNIDARDNDGDRLYGDNVREGSDSFLEILRGGQEVREKRAEGNISYTANFECVLDKPYDECRTETILDPISGFPIGERQVCTTVYPECTVPVPVTFGVAIATPEADTVWDRLVSAHMSVFRRIFPKIGEDTPVDEIEDIPGKTRVRYGSDGHTGSPGEVTGDTLAGDPAKGRSGGSAELYFPHLGGIQEYFMYGIQEALRPYGYSSVRPGESAGNNPRTVYTGDYCNPEFMTDAFGGEAEGAACVCGRESSGNANALNDSCLEEGGTYDYSVGLFQINMLAHCPQGFDDVGDYVSSDGFLITTVACVPGTGAKKAIFDECYERFSNPELAKDYAKYLRYETPQGWRHWSYSARQCGLI